MSLPVFGNACEEVFRGIRAHALEPTLRSIVPISALQRRCAFRVTPACSATLPSVRATLSLVAAKQVLKIKVRNCGGLRDLLSELEPQFLVSALGLFRNRADFGRGEPRAIVSLVRAYDARDFYESAFCDDEILHFVAHASTTELDFGVSKKRVLAADLEKKSKKLKRSLPRIVISSGCELQPSDWHKGLGAAGARILIASSRAVTLANLTAFNMSFYSALLARVRKGATTLERVKAAFELADKHYRAVDADGTPLAKFSLVEIA